MSQSAVGQFTQSLSRADATSSVVTRDEFDENPRRRYRGAGNRRGAFVPGPLAGESSRDARPEPRPVTRGQDGRDRFADKGIAGLGTVVVQSRRRGDEPVSLFPERHVVVLQASDLRRDLESAFEWLADEFDAGRDSLVFETGPSATGDMGALVQGVHGPSEVHVIVVEDDE